MIKYLETYLGKWIGWKSFFYNFFLGVAFTFGAALVAIAFYSYALLIFLL